MEILGANFRAEDCEKFAKQYCELLGGKISKASQNHAEWILSKHLVYFNRESEACPVAKGTITIQLNAEENQELEEKLESTRFQTFFQKSTEFSKHNYWSFVDPEGNRTWVVVS